MRSRVVIGAIAAVLAAFLIFGLGMQAGSMTYGAHWWGPGMMGGYAMGPWMMNPAMAGGYGYAMPPWMMAFYRTDPTATLSVDEVRRYFERSLAWQGNPRVKLGPVSETDADTITADILTTDKDGLVQRFAVNRHTGFVQPSED